MDKRIKKYEEITINPQYANYPDWEIDIEKKEQQLLAQQERIVFQ